MRHIGIRVVAAVLLFATPPLLAMPADDAPRPGDPHPTIMLVPAYFYPAGDRLADWNRLAEAARSIPLEVILNPASGPGKRQDANYVAVLHALHQSHARVLAYVDSDYGRRPLAAIEKDVGDYPKFYKIDGFFIDQMANTPEAVDHYRSIRRLIRRADSRYKVVGNPGTYTRPEYLDAADTLVTFEGSARAFAAYNPHAAAPWIAGYPPDRFAAIIYGVDEAAAGRAALSRAKRTGAGSVFITDQEMPNPYLALPPYWADEAAAVRAINQPRKPEDIPPPAPKGDSRQDTGTSP
jgi:Spherulation-specific family 4